MHLATWRRRPTARPAPVGTPSGLCTGFEYVHKRAQTDPDDAKTSFKKGELSRQTKRGTPPLLPSPPLSNPTKPTGTMTLFSSLKSKASKSDSDSDSDPPPRYSQVVGDDSNDSSNSSSAGGFVPSATLQVEAIGYDTNQALTGRTLENISVFRLGSRDAEYVSVRVKKNSNSCALVRASDETPLISTVYRFGPGRHPRMRILDSQMKVSVEDAINDDNVTGEQVEVKSRSMISRAQTFDMSFGKFEWRYGKRKERAAFDADNILILERTDSISLPGGGQSKTGARVAHLIRNDQYRTPGSKKYSGGNGGRLFIDLRIWGDDKHTNLQTVETFVVASSILMLKREADRFIDNHIAAVS